MARFLNMPCYQGDGGGSWKQCSGTLETSVSALQAALVIDRRGGRQQCSTGLSIVQYPDVGVVVLECMRGESGGTEKRRIYGNLSRN